MDVKTGRKPYPKSVLTFYLKLYCSRRDTNTTANKMMEGIKSWLSLSKTEKQHFIDKYKECQSLHKNKLANVLKKAEPFMKKKKNVKRFDEDGTAKNEPIVDVEKETNESRDRISEIHSNNIIGNNSLCNISEPDIANNHITECENEAIQLEPNTPCEYGIPIGETQYNITPVLNEPTAPSIWTGKELFEMLNSDNHQENISWASLSSSQKNRYQRATTLLKNDYITKYKAYLESLPSKKLFEYYVNFFN